MDQEKNKSIDEAVKRAEARNRNVVSDIERHQMQQKMRDKARQHLVSHAVTEWTLVRSLAWSERIIVLVAAILLWQDKAHDLWSVSGIGFCVVSLAFLGPIYGILMFLSLLVIYKVLKSQNVYPKDAKGFKKVTYPTFAAWCPLIYFMSHIAMNFYYELISTIPAWESAENMWNTIKHAAGYK